MSDDKKHSSVLSQIAVAVGIAVLVGGTAPWWWKELFSGNGSTSTSISTPTPAPARTHENSEGTPTTTIAGSYWMDGMSHRVITVQHLQGAQYRVAEYTSPWKWEGDVVVQGNEIKGQVRFLSNSHPLWIEGTLAQGGNITVTYVFLDEKNQQPTGRRDPHVWVRQR